LKITRVARPDRPVHIRHSHPQAALAGSSAECARQALTIR